MSYMRMWWFLLSGVFFTNSLYGSVCVQNLGSNIYSCPPKMYPDIDQGECYNCPEGYYCPGGHFAFCCNSNTDGNFPKSDKKSENITDCYKTISCKKADDSDIECRHYQNETYECPSTDSNGIHTEGDQCYIGHRNCSLFNTNGCNGSIYGDARWISGSWNVTWCECRREEFNDTTNFCRAKRNKKANSTTINGVDDTIDYNNGELKKRWCISCMLGYYVKTDNILHVGGSNTECIVDEEDGGQWAVCKCTPAPQGTWVSSCNITYPITNPDNPICYTTNCPPGKTTNGPQSVSADECHYSRDTKFCDANGCFNITDADTGNWNWDY